LAATREWLHQEQRGPAMPESLALVHELRASGVPAVISGAGPTVLALAGGDADDVARWCPQGWRALVLGVESRGAVVG
ncbi:MAG: homoserine kinase, partial [Streptomyces albidoflavus]